MVATTVLRQVGRQIRRNLKINAGGPNNFTMGMLTGTQPGDAANDLLAFYTEKNGGHSLRLSPRDFNPEYLLVEFGEYNGGELEIPASEGSAGVRRRRALNTIVESDPSRLLQRVNRRRVVLS